ncbi:MULTISPECIES: hypothetical protein [Nocardioides]|uniref:Uncharacterized protein n=1 Tax=Nocardioides vastitatis TaxID=2568655 RepID=A0ABW0ZMM1_9ACTN|nr:hypothetical protein [Nocardioides sp.]THJ10722.1 hypothetical protein E7Z54_02580 [Nocardioides sp.]
MKRYWSLFIPIVLALTWVGLPSAPAGAGGQSTTVEFGFAPSTSRATNGDTIEILGVGTFTLQPKTVSGEAPNVTAAFGEVPRLFTHRNAEGTVLAQGRWQPTAVLSYRSYGPATPEQDEKFGGLPPGTEGGKLRLKIALYVDGAQVDTGVLTVDCLLGMPPKNAEESVLLVLQDAGIDFTQPVHGDSVFIRH